MTHTKKASFVAIISFLVILWSAPTTVFAQWAPYYGGGDSFLPNLGNGPRQELYVHTWGPSSPTPTYLQQYPSYTAPSYAPYAAPTNYYAPQYTNAFAPQYAVPAYQDFNSKFANYTVIAPQYGYVTPTSNQFMGTGVPSYATPSYGYPSYGTTGYNLSGTYAPQTGLRDFWGNPMCYWGSDYGNFPCDRDPHQWIQDPYTGSWY